MSPRLIVSITAFVAAAHWLILWGPLYAPWLPAWETHSEPSRMDTVWIAPNPALEKPAARDHNPAPPPPTAPTPPLRPRAKKAVQPPPLPMPAAPADVSNAPVLTTASTAAPKVTDTAPAPSVDHIVPTDPAPVAGPSLQVRHANGESLQLLLPEAGSALATHIDLRYQVHGFVDGMQYHANATLQWNSDGQRYQARQSVSAFLLGSLEQTSSGNLTAQGLQPLEFMDRRMFKRRHVRFDWAQHLALFEPQRPAAPIGPGAQDRLSALLQLAAMLQTLPALRQPGTEIEIPTLGARSLQMWVFVVEGPETLQLPAGPTPTLRLRRLPKAGDQEQTQLWLDPAQGYVPARIHMQEPNGDVMDFSLKS